MTAAAKRFDSLMYLLIVGAVLSAAAVGVCWAQREAADNRIDTVLRTGDDRAVAEGQTYNQLYEAQMRTINNYVAAELVFGCLAILSTSAAAGLYIRSRKRRPRVARVNK